MSKLKSLSTAEIIQYRLYNQQISKSNFNKPIEIVRWFGAMQAQDYAGVKWSVALRLPLKTDVNIEKSIAERKIIRTWLLRGTLHFTAAEDIRWILTLVTPKIIAGSKTSDNQIGLDNIKYNLSNKILIKALQGGKQLTREELKSELSSGGIKADGMQLSHILQRAALEQLICFGIKRGKQFTYTLLDEWIPGVKTKILDKQESLCELGMRYFISHGPATLQDFTWWSALSAADSRECVQNIKSQLVEKTNGNKTYWMAKAARTANTSRIFLLPGFDEYIIGYKDRSEILKPEYTKLINAGGGILSQTILIDGRVAGIWKRKYMKDKVIINLKSFNDFTKKQRELIHEVVEEYGKFHAMKIELA